MPANKPTTSLPELLEVVFRQRWKMILIPTVVLACGLAVALFAPRSYRSEAKLFLQVGRDSVAIDPSAQTGQSMISLQQMGRDSEVTTAMDLLQSRGVIAKVVDKVGVDYVLRGGPAGSGPSDPVSDAIQAASDATLGQLIKTVKSIDPISDREEAIIQVEENLGVDAERDSTLIQVTYSTDTPVGAQHVLTTLIDIYRAEHLRIHRNEGSRVFFEEQEEMFRDQLDEAMDSVRLAKDEIGVASVEARRQNLESQIQSITMQIYQAETERTATSAELADLRRQLVTAPARLISSKKQVPNQGADLLREQLYELQVRQMDLRARYSESHPLVVAVSQQVEAAKEVVDDQSLVREETVDDVNPIHRQLEMSVTQNESELASIQGRLEMLREQADTVRKDLEKINADAVRVAQLEREESLASRKYHRDADSLEQTRIDQELENQKVSSISLAQEPSLAEKPVSPSKLLVALGSLFLAFAGTAATVLGLEQMNDKLRTESSIEHAIDAPVLASIPESSVHGRVLAP